MHLPVFERSNRSIEQFVDCKNYELQKSILINLRHPVWTYIAVKIYKSLLAFRKRNCKFIALYNRLFLVRRSNTCCSKNTAKVSYECTAYNFIFSNEKVRYYKFFI